MISPGDLAIVKDDASLYSRLVTSNDGVAFPQGWNAPVVGDFVLVVGLIATPNHNDAGDLIAIVVSPRLARVAYTFESVLREVA